MSGSLRGCRRTKSYIPYSGDKDELIEDLRKNTRVVEGEIIYERDKGPGIEWHEDDKN
jgi:hypothetical protein